MRTGPTLPPSEAFASDGLGLYDEGLSNQIVALSKAPIVHWVTMAEAGAQMRTVNFTQMKEGTRADYDLLAEREKHFHAMTADRVLAELARQGDDTLSGYRITRLHHGLQSATRAKADGADIDWVVGALLHDVGDGLAAQNHDRMSAEVIRPFVREEVAWVVEHHGIFQMVFYAHHYGWDADARERFRGHLHFDACAAFCERWDQASFDPDYPTEPLAAFEPLVREVFARKAYDPAVLRPGVSVGLPG